MSMRDSGALRTDRASELQEFAQAVCAGLSKPGQKEIPSKYLYDEVGSALFDVITLLPEYGLTRADGRLLRQHAPSMMEHLPLPVVTAELGSGTGRKTRWILEALARREPVTYYPIDVSATALAICGRNLGVFEDVSVVGLEASYLDGLKKVSEHRRPGQTLLVLFLGSTIGNFEAPAAVHFLREVRKCMIPGDALLLGTDLQKPVEMLRLAYNDHAGVTAAFNRNLLARMNRELGCNLDLDHFVHEAQYNDREHRIEMHLRSTRTQTVMIPAADFTGTLEEGETIWTECSHKFRVEDLPAMAHQTGFRSEAQWVDGEWPFAENLWLAV